MWIDVCRGTPTDTVLFWYLQVLKPRKLPKRLIQMPRKLVRWNVSAPSKYWEWSHIWCHCRAVVEQYGLTWSSHWWGTQWEGQPACELISTEVPAMKAPSTIVGSKEVHRHVNIQYAWVDACIQWTYSSSKCVTIENNDRLSTIIVGEIETHNVRMDWRPPNTSGSAPLKAFELIPLEDFMKQTHVVNFSGTGIARI